MDELILQRHNVNTFGEGDAHILFAHGFGCDQNMWRFVTPGFEEHFTIVLFDFMGHGKSDMGAYDPKRYGTLNGYAQDVLDVCRALEITDVVLVGHSVGAIICMLAAIEERDRFEKLIMVSPSPRYIDDEPEYKGGFSREDIIGLLDAMEKGDQEWADFLAPQVMRNLERPGLTEELKRSFCSTHPEVAKEFARITFLGDNRDDLADVPIPTLVLQCAEDVIAPIDVGRYVADRVPRSTFRMLSATGHCPHMSAPFETMQAIKEYLGLVR